MNSSDNKPKRVEEELAFKHVILQTQQEASIDGILVVDDAGELVSFNTRFIDMWGIPPEVAESRSDSRALNSVLGMLSDPEGFLKKVHDLYERKGEKSRDEISLKDGRVFDRYSAPLTMPDGRYLGRVWFFRDITDRKRAEERLKRINVCLLELGTDFDANIARLTALCGELLGATCALYNRLDSGMLCSIGQWNTPTGYISCDKPDGHICYDVIRHGNDQPRVVTHLAQTPYATTDRNVNLYGLKTYLGQVVRRAGKPIGSLCVVFQEDREPTSDDKHILSIIASSLSREEDRKQAEDSVRDSKANLVALLNATTQSVFLLDCQGMVLAANEIAARRYGLQLEELLGRCVYDHTPSELVEPRQFYVAQVVATGQPLRFQDQQSGRWMKHSLMPVKDEHGDVIRIAVFAEDVTERKRAVDAMRASEKTYRSLFDHMLNGVAYCRMVFNKDGPNDYTYLKVNGAFESLTGWKNVVGKTASEALPGIQTTDADLLEIYGRVALTGKPEKFEKYIEAAKMWFSISVYSPEKEYFVAVFDVITERKRAEEALRKSEEQHRTILQTAMDGYWMVDLQGRLVEVNEAYCRMSGYTEQELLTMSISDLEAVETPADTATRIQRFMTHGGDRFETRHRRKDGSTFDVEISIQYKPMDGGRMVAFMRDITRRKRSEEALRASEEKYRTLFESAGDAIFIHDMEARILAVNAAACEQYGYTESELLSMTVGMMDTPEQAAHVPERISRLMEQGSLQFETEHRHKDGSPISVDVNSKRIIWNGQPAMMSICRNVTGRKQAKGGQ